MSELSHFRPTSTIRRAGIRKEARPHTATRHEKNTAVLTAGERPYMSLYFFTANADAPRMGQQRLAIDPIALAIPQGCAYTTICNSAERLIRLNHLGFV